VCELLGISSNRPAAWGDPLTLFRKRGGKTADNPDGWGLAFREADAWQLHKAPGAAIQSERFVTLSQTLVTNLLIAHVRKANPPSAYTSQILIRLYGNVVAGRGSLRITAKSRR